MQRSKNNIYSLEKIKKQIFKIPNWQISDCSLWKLIALHVKHNIFRIWIISYVHISDVHRCMFVLAVKFLSLFLYNLIVGPKLYTTPEPDLCYHVKQIMAYFRDLFSGAWRELSCKWINRKYNVLNLLYYVKLYPHTLPHMRSKPSGWETLPHCFKRS